MDGSFIELEAETIERHVNESWKIMYKMEKAFGLQELPVCAGNCKSLKEDIDKFKVYVPIITALRNPGMRDRHWDQLTEELGQDLHPDETFSLTQAIEMGIPDKKEIVTKICDVSGKEYSIEMAMAKMKGEWKDVELAVIDYRETGTYVIRVDEQVVQQLDDHIVMSQSMEHQVLFHRVADRHLPKLTPRARGAHGVGPGPPANAGAGRVPGRGGRGAPTDSTGSRGPGGLRARGLAAPRPATAAARRRTGCGCGGPPPRRGGSGPLLRSSWGSVRPRGTGMGSTSGRTASGARRHTQNRRRPSPSGPAAPRAR